MESAEMSPFEKLPGEIRNLIYRSCLKHDEDTITPLPTEYERAALLRRGLKVPCKPRDPPIRRAPITAKIDYQSYDPKWPAVALLGVNRLIHNEVLPILFGGNVWRLSCQFTWPLSHRTWKLWQRPTVLHGPYIYWAKYAEHFQRLTCEFRAMDLSHNHMRKRFRRYLGRNPTCSAGFLARHHTKLLQRLCDGPMADKVHMTEAMKNLKMIKIKVGKLACPGGCCRTTVLTNLIMLWKLSMVQRLRRWGPTRTLIERAGPRNFRCYMGSRSGVVGVGFLRSEQEANMFLEHWWRPTQENPEFEMLGKKACGKREYKEFWKSTRPFGKAIEGPDLAASGAQASVSDGAEPNGQGTGKAGTGRVGHVHGWLSRGVKKAWCGRKSLV